MISELLMPAEVKRERDLLIEQLMRLASEKETASAATVGEPSGPSATDLRALAQELLKEKQQEEAREKQFPAPSDKAKGAYIPSSPFTCVMQSLLEETYRKKGVVQSIVDERELAPGDVIFSAEGLTDAVNEARGLTIGGFEDGEDVRYVIDGLAAVLDRIATGKAHFNDQGSRPAELGEKARVVLFGDWATGIPRAQDLAKQIARELINNQKDQRQHLIHLGDTYYAGRKSEYLARFLPYWPQTGSAAATHWSLNGNHDMYSGGQGYFETLLATEPFKSNHKGEENGAPTSYFLLQNSHWQIFALDSAYHSPQLTGMDGAIDDAQIAYIKKHFDSSKGVILLTHHQLFSARAGEGQSHQIRDELIKHGIWPNVAAWIWGHEHRCTLYAPAWTQANYQLPFAMCLGNGGVPTVIKGEPYTREAVAWEYLDSLDLNGSEFMKFAFATLAFDSKEPGKVSVEIFGAEGTSVHSASFTWARA